MKYTMEELSPCKRKVHVCVEAAEINAAINAAVALQAKGIALAGFRKGHVPAHLVEKRFMGQLYHDAAQDLTNVHINSIISENGLTPLGAVNTENATPFKRDTDMEYDLVFEHMPVFELPDYEGIEAEEEKVEVSEKEVDDLVERFRKGRAKMVPVEGDGPAKDGEFVNIDFDIQCEGAETEKSNGTDLLVGQKGILPEIDELAKSLKTGQTGSKDVVFPEKFPREDLIGKTAKLTMTVHAIKRLELPELDEQLFSAFKVSSLEEFRGQFKKFVGDEKRRMFVSECQTKMLEGLLKRVDFPIPKVLFDRYMVENLQHAQERAVRLGQSLPKEKLEELKKSLEPAVTYQAKSLIFLLAVAKKEGLEVSEQEIQKVLAQEAYQNKADLNQLYNYYRETGEIFHLRDLLLSDKAMRSIYAKAKVTLVEKKAEAPAAEAAATEEKPAEAPAE